MVIQATGSSILEMYHGKFDEGMIRSFKMIDDDGLYGTFYSTWPYGMADASELFLTAE